MTQPASTAEQTQRARKQLQTMQQVLAGNVVSQLVGAGCDSGQLIDFASEILRCITERGRAGADTRPKAGTAQAAKITPVLFRLEKTRNNRHTVHGERISLKPVARSDRPLLEAWLEDPEIRKTFGSSLLAYLVGHMDSLAADEQRRDFLVCGPAGRRIGAACLFNMDAATSQSEIAKLLGDPSARGRGYAKEAVRALLGYAFKVLKLRRVYLRTAGFNLHNIRLNEKLGFKFEGILRESRVLNGKPVDVVLMSMLRREYFRAFRLKDAVGQWVSEKSTGASGPSWAA